MNNDNVEGEKEESKENEIILKQLLRRKLKNVHESLKLEYDHIVRISKYIDSSIFDKDKCSLWKGYVTNYNNKQKGAYINFSFKGKKRALHRLIYANYVDPTLSLKEYIKFTCPNNGQCINVYHMLKYTYNQSCNFCKTVQYFKSGKAITKIIENRREYNNSNDSNKKEYDKSFFIVEF
jgi:hypothetical protein